MEKKKQVTEIPLEKVKSLMEHLSSLPRIWIIIVTVIILLSMFEITQTTEKNAEGTNTNFTVNFHLTTITVVLVALIWLPSLLRVISLLGGGIKTSVGEASTEGLLAHFSMAIDPSLKELPHISQKLVDEKKQTNLEAEEIYTTTPAERAKERANIYERNRDIFLVHVLQPSKVPTQKYDIFIYLIGHQQKDLSDIKKAEFFFGRYWGNKIFTGKKIGDVIGVSTSAYGSFLCTCLITFSDDSQVSLYRYIDFEMGDVVNKALTT